MQLGKAFSPWYEQKKTFCSYQGEKNLKTVKSRVPLDLLVFVMTPKLFEV